MSRLSFHTDNSVGEGVDAAAFSLAMVLRVERILLQLRYMAFFLMLALYLLGLPPHNLPVLLALGAGALIHNSYVLWVLYRRRYKLFLTLSNFVIYLFSVTLLVGMTGADESPLVSAFLIIIIGYSIYSPTFLNTSLVTIICCMAYGAIILTKSFFAPVDLTDNAVLLNFSIIMGGGWLMSWLGVLLGRFHLESRRQAQAIASSELMLRTILDNTADPIVVCDEHAHIAEVNDQARAFLGGNRNSLIGRPFQSLFRDRTILEEKPEALPVSDFVHREVEVSVPGEDDCTVDLLIRGFQRDGQHFFVAMFHDISQQKAFQEAALLARQKLEQANIELQQLNELRTAFVTMITRRLRSPLSAILGYAGIMLDGELGEITEEQRQALQQCRETVLRIFTIIDEPLASADSLDGKNPGVTMDAGTEKRR